METLKVLLEYFPTSIFTGKCLVFVSEEHRVELTEHRSRDFSSDQTQPSFIRVKIFRNEMGKFVQTHMEDFHLPDPSELAEQIERYVLFAINRNIREII